MSLDYFYGITQSLPRKYTQRDLKSGSIVDNLGCCCQVWTPTVSKQKKSYSTFIPSVSVRIANKW